MCERTALPIVVLGFLIALAGCSAHTLIEPLPRGAFVPNLSLGGPIVEAFDTRIPVPYLTAGGDYGLTNDVSAHANLHVMPLVYGVAGLDVGALWFPLVGTGRTPTVGFGPRIFMFAGLRPDVADRFMGYPALSGSASWALGRGRIYGGADVAVRLAGLDYDDETTGAMVSPFVGYRLDRGRRISMFLELKWHAANVQSHQLVPGYVGLGRRGAVSPLVSVQRRF